MTPITYGTILIMIGVWLLADGLFSYFCYPEEGWRTHWVRFFRCALGGLTGFMGYYFLRMAFAWG